MKPKITVVIPTYNRNDLLKRCLGALVDQTLSKSFFEVIVVDDANNEQTKKLVEKFREKESIKIIYLPMNPHGGPASARNAGWKHAKSNIIAFTDDDCLPDKNWFKAGLQTFTEDTAGVAGKIVVPLSAQPTDYEKNTAYLEHSEFVTANCFYRKNILEKVEGFDENFKMAWREDADLFFTLLEKGYHMVTSKKAIVVHPVRTAPWGISIKEQKKSLYNALLYKKHPQLYKQKIQQAPPWHYYVIIVFFFIGLLGFVYENYALSLTALIGWLFFVIKFFLKRINHTRHTFSHSSEMLATSLLIPFLSIFWRLYGGIKYRVFFM